MARIKNAFMIGMWCKDASNKDHFVPCELQPEPPITDAAELEKWAKAKLEAEELPPREYDVIRFVPGKLTVAKQLKFKVGFNNG